MLKHILEQVKQLEQALIPLVEKEEQEQQGKEINLGFVYEQLFTDLDGWHPHYQTVYAPTIGRAFAAFGNMVDAMHLNVRNINYGFWDEMQPEYERIDAYWKEYRRKRKEQ